MLGPLCTMYMEWSKDAPLAADAMRGLLIASASMISPNVSDSRIISGRRSSLILSSLRQEGRVGMPFLCGQTGLTDETMQVCNGAVDTVPDLRASALRVD